MFALSLQYALMGECVLGAMAHLMAAGADKDEFLVKPGLAYMTFLSVWMF